MSGRDWRSLLRLEDLEWEDLDWPLGSRAPGYAGYSGTAFEPEWVSCNKFEEIGGGSEHRS